jgi:hypothetical protein
MTCHKEIRPDHHLGTYLTHLLNQKPCQNNTYLGTMQKGDYPGFALKSGLLS